ncbi:nuclear transport factor 2 family protein [Sphingobium amiense]|uniref:Nuclear transport factor 2 family protein n=1 Tax=Sphingobium amiense TaxID=135719 RepID=A0A494WFV8_9SPHN|nr:nuclear transport factor 2 family protein [Sphingobium amiense]BBD99775.1 nuclear transport factor 2 family protein [Sphingobium amiense]
MDMERYTQVRAMVDRIYALSAAGEWDAVEAMLTDDFRILEADSLPYAGAYEGKGALQSLYAKVFGYWDDPALETGDICVGRDHAVAMVVVTATSRHNGERLRMPLTEVFHLRGDRFSGITPYYFDTASIARATGLIAA